VPKISALAFSLETTKQFFSSDFTSSFLFLSHPKSPLACQGVPHSALVSQNGSSTFFGFLPFFSMLFLRCFPLTILGPRAWKASQARLFLWLALTFPFGAFFFSHLLFFLDTSFNLAAICREFVFSVGHTPERRRRIRPSLMEISLSSVDPSFYIAPSFGLLAWSIELHLLKRFFYDKPLFQEPFSADPPFPFHLARVVHFPI